MKQKEIIRDSNREKKVKRARVKSKRYEEKEKREEKKRN